MKHVKVIFSLVFIALGIVIITFSNLVEQVLPKLGFAAFQAAAAGLYTPDNYQVDLSLNYWAGALCILGGAVALAWEYLQKQWLIIQEKNREFEERRNRGEI